MRITNEEVERLAELAKLQFNNSEIDDMKLDLDKIIGFIEKLNELDTENVEPLLFMTDETNVLRDDVASTSITQQEALLNAPHKDSDYIKIPTVLKTKS